MTRRNDTLGEFAVVADGLSRDFGSVKAVDRIDLAVSNGEIYGFLGPNGAGKTTVLRMLTTLLLPTGGSARVAGYDIVKEPNAVRLRIGAARYRRPPWTPSRPGASSSGSKHVSTAFAERRSRDASRRWRRWSTSATPWTA